ncbi:DNA-binding protein, partial [uncultured Thiocystis sp.]|jgi:chromosome segregation ATPase|uniref:DNA-binding protein n=1 Tax=uncultured Thiocystis sp. TaxID=1202134 RepID=UPI0026015F45
VAAVRARLGGRGGQQAVQAGVNDWVLEAARRFQLPALPAALQTAMSACWDVAYQAAKGHWEGERTALREQLGAQDTQLASLHAAHQALAQTSEQQTQEGRERQQALDCARAELFDTHHQLRDTTAQAAALTQHLTETQAQAQQGEHARLTLAEQVRTLEALGQRQHAAVQRAEREGAQWQAQAHAAAHAVARLEQALAAGAHEQTRLAEAQDALSAAHAALAERETRLETLTQLLARVQDAHEADSGHWMVQIDEQRQALKAAQEREQRSARERQALWQQVQTLAQVLRDREPGGGGPAAP